MEHSGYITLDFDKIREKGQSPEEVKEEASRHPAVAMGVHQPRGGWGEGGRGPEGPAKDQQRESPGLQRAGARPSGLLSRPIKHPSPSRPRVSCRSTRDCYYAAPETVGPFDWRAYADSHAKRMTGRKKGKRAGSQSAGTGR